MFLEESGQIIKDYSLGITRVPLEEMGCARLIAMAKV